MRAGLQTLAAALLTTVLALAQLPQPLPAASAPASAPVSPHRPEQVLARLQEQTPASIADILAILGCGPPASQVQVAQALAGEPILVRTEYLEPLAALLQADDAGVRASVVEALAISKLDAVLPPLLRIVESVEARDSARRGAIEALARSLRRDRIGALVQVAPRLPPDLQGQVVQSVSEATAEPLTDLTELTAWWAKESTFDDGRWNERMRSRLARSQMRRGEQVAALERRLTTALRAGYLQAPAENRTAILLEYLTDSLPAVRRLGLELVEVAATEGEESDLAVQQAVRLLLPDRSPEVRSAAARAIAAWRVSADEALLLAQLGDEPVERVRRSLTNALGHVGSDASLDPLVRLANGLTSQLSIDAVVALGRIARRGDLAPEARGQLAATLIDLLQRVDPARVEARAALLSTLAFTGDPRAVATLLPLSGPAESPVVLAAAIRGLAHLAAPSAAGAPRKVTAEQAGQIAEGLVPVTAHADPILRRLALETLGLAATSAPQLEPLLTRAGSAEPDEAVRTASWRALLAALERRPLAEFDDWLRQVRSAATLPESAAAELLEVGERVAQREDAAPAERAALRLELAQAYAAIQNHDQALKAYLGAFADLIAVDVDRARATGVAAVRLALLTGRYNPEVAAGLARGDIPAEWWWQQVRPLVEERLNEATIGEAITMLESLRAAPPGSAPEQIVDGLDELLERARGVEQEYVRGDVEAQLLRLREAPEDAAARDRIVAYGRRALPVLSNTLARQLSSEPLDAEAEQRLLDLIRAIEPEWPGFRPEDPAPAKRKALEQLNA